MTKRNFKKENMENGAYDAWANGEQIDSYSPMSNNWFKTLFHLEFNKDSTPSFSRCLYRPTVELSYIGGNKDLSYPKAITEKPKEGTTCYYIDLDGRIDTVDWGDNEYLDRMLERGILHLSEIKAKRHLFAINESMKMSDDIEKNEKNEENGKEDNNKPNIKSFHFDHNTLIDAPLIGKLYYAESLQTTGCYELRSWQGTEEEYDLLHSGLVFAHIPTIK